MSMKTGSDLSEPRTQAKSPNNYKEPLRSPGSGMKCRIPQRMCPSPSGRRPITSVSLPRARPPNYLDPTKLQYGVMSSPNGRFSAKNTSRPRSDESRPKSAGRLKEELFPSRPTYITTRFTKPIERVPYTLKKPSTLPRRMTENHKAGRIVVPTQKPPVTTYFQNQYSPLNQGECTAASASSRRARSQTQLRTRPDDEHLTCSKPGSTYSIPNVENRQYDDLELRLSEISGGKSGSPEANDQSEGRECVSVHNDKAMQLKITWQAKVIQFEQMKSELKDRQKNILEQYAIMREIHQNLTTLGEEACLPSAEDLEIMNVAKMTPEQLLQLCADDVIALPDNHHWDGKTPLSIDMNKFYNMPTKLVHTCEQTLAKRKEIIDWFGKLTTEEKGIKLNKLTQKVNEFNAENDMLKCTLDLVKAEFLKELDEIVNLMRKGVNKTMALHLRTEELTYELSELNSQNMDLRKQLQNADHLRSHTNRARVEELEKELKNEKCKRLFLRERFCRSEGQVKINMERAAQLESTLEQAQSQIWSLERTVQLLNEQNQKMQSDFEKELSILNESLKKHTDHLEEIADAREKLQLEKEDLEKRLAELSEYYNESLKNMKQEMSSNVAKLIEMEKKYEKQGEDKKGLEGRLETLTSQLTEAELRYKDTIQHLHAMEFELEKLKESNKELEITKKELEKANIEISNNKDRFAKQNEVIEKFERSLKEATDSMESLKCDVSSKDEYIIEMEKKQALLEQQLQENENKMEEYVKQLSSLKTHINELQEDFGDFENLRSLQEMVNQQRAKLLEATRQNGELAEALQKKDKEIEEYNETLSDHEKVLLEREDVIKMFSEKEEEQTNIIKILRHNLELRSQADNELNQQIMEKNVEIDSLVVNLETRKQQISNLEKIILTLEDQTRKASQTRKKDQECILQLQKKLAEYESFHMEASRNIDTPAENLDSLIKILEDELETSIVAELHPKEHEYNNESKKKYIGDRKRDMLEEHDDRSPQTRFNSESGAYPDKITRANVLKKSHVAGNGEQYSGDNLDRKKAITNIDTQKWGSPSEPGHNVHTSLPTKDNTSTRRYVSGPPQKPYFSRNLVHLSPDQQREDKKYKMFKLAGHRL